jgi:hypothetical protein
MVSYSELAPKEECLHVFPGFVDIEATPRGVWLLGGCGVRVRIRDGKLERFPTVKEEVPVMANFTCTAHRMHWSIWAPGEEQAFLLGSPRCGGDPNAVWGNDLERFDGKRWTPVKAKFGAGNAHESDAFKLSGADGVVYAIVEGDAWHGPPDNAIASFDGKRVEELVSGLGAKNRKLLAAARADPTAPGAAVPTVVDYQHYQALEAVSKDDLWIVGAWRRYDQGEKHRAGAVWRWHGRTWFEYPVDDEHLGAVAVAPDGTVIVAGDGLWLKSPEAKSFRLFDRGFAKGGNSLGARGIAARAADDVWIALSCMEGDCAGPDGIHFDGARLTRVEKSWPEGVPQDMGLSREPRVEAAPGGPVWLMGEQVLWRLEAGGEPAARRTQ